MLFLACLRNLHNRFGSHYFSYQNLVDASSNNTLRAPGEAWSSRNRDAKLLTPTFSNFWRLDLRTFPRWTMIIVSPFSLRLMVALSVQLELSNGGLVSMESARSMAQFNLT